MRAFSPCVDLTVEMVRLVVVIPLVQVIRGRVRRLEADLTSSRRLAEERGAEAARLQRSLDAATAVSAERLEAINRLEEDLASVTFHAKTPSSALGLGGGGMPSGAGGAAGAGFEGGGGGAEGAEALRELLGVADEDGGTPGGTRGGGGRGEMEGHGHGVLGIMQVRSRFSVLSEARVRIMG